MRLRLGLAVAALGLATAAGAALPGASSGPVGSGALTSEITDQPRQTSDGLPGQIAKPVSARVSSRAVVRRVREWRVAPGVTFRRWDRIDYRGPIRAQLLTVNTRRRGVQLDYASGERVPDRAALTTLLRRDRKVVAGVNGGFFDIYDTGAPLGVGHDRQRGFLHAAKYTWTNAFSIDRAGTARIGPSQVEAVIHEHPEIEITNINSPRVREGRVGVYDESWGTTSGFSITDGQKDKVRAVVVQDGVVVSNSTQLPSGTPVVGTLLVGRGPGAVQLEALTVGSVATVARQLAGSYRFAISGESILLQDRRVMVTDDVYLHPRTAVGIDRDTGRILLLAIDGRQGHSRGYTMVELARMMKQLGAESALNLDGGGSTTLAGLTPRDRFRVLNSPSDGTQRAIPDGIAVLFNR